VRIGFQDSSDARKGLPSEVLVCIFLDEAGLAEPAGPPGMDVAGGAERL